MEQGLKLITISDLLRCGRPLTAASSLNFSSSSSSSPALSKSNKSSQSPNPNPKILTPLNHPAVLIGNLGLSPPPSSDTLTCPHKTCFQFFDDSSSAAICADILGFTVHAIGSKIKILAWNFIPFNKHSGGFLEIIKWSFLDPINSHCSIPLVLGFSSCSSSIEDNKLKKPCYSAYGHIESTSPVSLVLCSTSSSKSQNLRGFIVRMRVCECNLCNSKDSVQFLHNVVQGRRGSHCFDKPLIVYFCGDASSCWHPAITKLVGCVVALSGLKRKLVFVGKDESRLMFVTTKNSVLHLPWPSKKWLPFGRNGMKGKRECAAYTGVVKGVYMQGMVVELDKEVWLLLTDQLFMAPHSLRVGAIITVKNVHFVNPKFCWTKVLILGTCFKSSITVESFSPLESRCYVVAQSQGQLGKFIESLTFSARLWALLSISCFRKKFAGILSEKEILGSKHKEGLAQMFASLHLPPVVFQARHGVLAESCKHDSCSCGSEPNCGNLKLVAPISTFIHHCEAIWMRMLLQLDRNCLSLSDNTHVSILPPERRSRGQPFRKIFRSEDIGVLLSGSLKISASSGRLQLVDATGSIDVIIPDLPSTWKANCIYEVVDYSVVMEGAPELSDHMGLLDNESLSCRHIFHCTPWEREMKLAIYAYFSLSNAKCKNHPFYPSASQNDVIEELQNGRFHLISVTHKYPLLQKFQVDTKSDRSSIFAEAIILPWDLSLAGRYGVSAIEVSQDQMNEPLEHYFVEDYQIKLPNKKCKTDKTSSRILASDLIDDQSSCGSELSTSSSFFREQTKSKCGDFCSFEISCLASVRSSSNHKLVSSGKLCCMKCNEKNGAVKVLLEFDSESFFKYQLLQIGSCYIIKHHKGECFCSIKEYDKISGGKVLITSRIHLWSISFSFDEVVANSKSSDISFQNDSSFSNEVLTGDQDEIILQWPSGISPESCSDVRLHFSADRKCLLEGKLSELKEGFIKPVMQEEILNDSPQILTTLSVSGLSSGSSCSNCLFPKGNLVSVIGHVVSIHAFDHNSAKVHLSCESHSDILQKGHFEGITDSLCIHVLSDNQMVKISGSLSKYAYPVGFRPGVVATFYRILELRGAGRLMLTPVSFIVLNSLRDTYELYCNKSSNPSTVHVSTASSIENAAAGTILELIRFADSKPMQFNCRVVAVHILILQKKNICDSLWPIVQSTSPSIDIPLAGFVLDDGSSSCCCWANAGRAASLLRLHEELPQRAFESSGCKAKMGMDSSSQKTSMYHLERILKKHNRITVKNYGSMVDSSFQDLTVSVSSDNILSSSDENLLKFIIFNACISRVWTVVASMMDLDTVKKLENEHLVSMLMAVQPLQNIWAAEVRHTDILTAARNLIHELLTG